MIGRPQGVSVSIIVPVHNGSATMDRAIASVMRQTFHAWELVLVDDGSDDATPELLEKWRLADGRVRVIRTEGGLRGVKPCFRCLVSQRVGDKPCSGA